MVTLDSRSWWRQRRKVYNRGLRKSGLLAFIAYCIAFEFSLPADSCAEISIFTIFAQGVGFLFAVGIANILYGMGPLVERVISPRDPERLRRVLFGLGYWFSVALPFSAPALVLMAAWFGWGSKSC